MVNISELVKLEGSFEVDVLHGLRDVQGVTVESIHPRNGHHGPDALIRYAGASQPVQIEVKRNINTSTAWQVIELAKKRTGSPVLLIADRTTREARAILQRHRISVIDGLGNIHLELPGLLVHMEANKSDRSREDKPERPVRLTGKAGIVALALLEHRGRSWHVQDIANQASVSATLAHRVLVRLEKESIVESYGTGPSRTRRVSNPTALLDLWAEENVDRDVVRMRAYHLARDPQELFHNITSLLDSAWILHAISGAAAASIVSPFVTAVPITEVWVTNSVPLEQIVASVGADKVDSGHNIVFAQSFGDFPIKFNKHINGLWTVNPFRLFYDLRRDPRRGREQADRIREEVIGY